MFCFAKRNPPPQFANWGTSFAKGGFSPAGGDVGRRGGRPLQGHFFSCFFRPPLMAVTRSPVLWTTWRMDW